MLSPEDRKLLQRYLYFVAPMKGPFIGVALLHLANALLNLIPATSLWILFDLVVARKEVGMWGMSLDGAALFPDRDAQIWGTVIFAAGLGITVLIANIIGVAMWRRATRVTQRLVLDVKRRVHMHLHKLSIGYFEKERTGSIMSRCVGDVEQMDQMLKQSFHLFYGCIHLVMVPMLMLSMSPALFLFVLPPIPILWWCVRRIQKKLRPMYRQMREQQAEIGAAIQEQINGIREIKAFGQERSAQRTYGRANIAHARIVHDAMKVFSVNHQLLYGTRDAAMLLVAIGGGWLAITGTAGVDVAMTVAFIALLTRFYDPIQQLIGFYDTIQRGLAATERVFGFLDIEPEVKDRPGAPHVDIHRGEVSFDHVTFAYTPDDPAAGAEPVLRDVSFTVEPGNTVAIVGSTGAGKTTLVSLLMRFYSPQSGCIQVDGHDIQEIAYSSLTDGYGMVFQETFLFYGTIAQNIGYARPDATLEQIEDAARRACIHDFIVGLPEGYETTVGERGVKLSGGQRQRLAIARMILKDPALVILDEATSAVDNQTERDIQRSLDDLLHGRTAFIIAHRLSTIRDADIVICMEAGRVAEMGPPQELEARGGVFSRLLAAGASVG